MGYDFERPDDIMISLDDNGDISEIKGECKSRDFKQQIESLKGVFNNGG